MLCYKVRIAGRVQGVGFRWFTRQQAERHGIRGHVRNARDGSVEVIACGDDDTVSAFLDVLRRGPSSAHVSDFSKERLDSPPDHEGFRIVQ